MSGLRLQGPHKHGLLSQHAKWYYLTVSDAFGHFFVPLSWTFVATPRNIESRTKLWRPISNRFYHRHEDLVGPGDHSFGYLWFAGLRSLPQHCCKALGGPSAHRLAVINLYVEPGIMRTVSVITANFWASWWFMINFGLWMTKDDMFLTILERPVDWYDLYPTTFIASFISAVSKERT